MNKNQYSKDVKKETSLCRKGDMILVQQNETRRLLRTSAPSLCLSVSFSLAPSVSLSPPLSRSLPFYRCLFSCRHSLSPSIGLLSSFSFSTVSTLLLTQKVKHWLDTKTLQMPHSRNAEITSGKNKFSYRCGGRGICLYIGHCTVLSSWPMRQAWVYVGQRKLNLQQNGVGFG